MVEEKIGWDVRWRCSWCYTRYTTDQYLALPMVPADPTESDPQAGHGYLAVCHCGKVFHRDKWRLQEFVGNALGRFWVSTVDLELNHGFNAGELWYETMIEGPDGQFSDYQPRYETREQAEAGHHRVCHDLKRLREDGLSVAEPETPGVQ